MNQHCVLAFAAALAAVAVAGPATGQEVITHTSECSPEGSQIYLLGDEITFEYHSEADPNAGAPLVVPPCVDVRFEAHGVTGKPPLAFEWTTDAGSHEGNPVEIDSGTLADGLQLVLLTVSNDHGTATHLSSLLVASLDAPPATPVADEQPSPDLEVTFTAKAEGAREWRWTFGDGSGPTPWIEHPCHLSTGVVTHTFPAPGTYPVVATARNCRHGQVASKALLVEVGSPDAITLTSFAADGCGPVFCAFARGDRVTFEVETSARPDRYLWDWNGDGTVDQVTVRVVGHVYEDFGIYSPRLTVERGSGSSTLSHERLLLIQ